MFKKAMFMSAPKKGDITISETTKESLQECMSHLKNATAYAARNDPPEVTLQIADVLSRVDAILRYNDMMDAVEQFSEKFQKDLDSD